MSSTARKTRQEIGQESLDRARNGQSIANDLAVIDAFAARGIEAHPRVDVFTYNGWRALGRQVKRGEKAVKITTWIKKPAERVSGDTAAIAALNGVEVMTSYPKAAFVFHISQTEPAKEGHA
jgi:hypothetical protein